MLVLSLFKLKNTLNLDDFILKAGVRVARASGIVIGEVVKPQCKDPANENCLVYKIH